MRCYVSVAALTAACLRSYSFICADSSTDGDYVQVTHTSKTSYSTSEQQDPMLVPLSSDSGSSTKSLIILGLIFVTSLLALGVVYLGFPKLDP